MSETVTADHPAANDLISGMRETATGVKRLGDECIRLQRELEAAQAAIHALETHNDDAAHTLDRWSELLEDFRLGVRDKDEILRETVGNT